MALPGYDYTDIRRDYNGQMQAWTFEWSDFVDYVDHGGSEETTGALLPTPISSRTTAVDEFIWYHLAPAVGFRVTRSGSTITVTSVPVSSKYNVYSYYVYSPDITFYYKNASGNYISIGTFGTYSDYNGVSHSVTVKDMNQAEIYVDCSHSACFVYKGNGKFFLGYIKLHSHITAPKPPTLVNVTGNTIELKSTNKADYYRGSDKTVLYNGTHIFNYENDKIAQGKTYSFKSIAECPDCPEKKVYESKVLKVKTWNITGSCSKVSTTSLTFTATHTPGTNGDASAHRIGYILCREKDTSTRIGSTLRSENGGSVTFTDLDPDTTYYCRVYTIGVTTKDGVNDNNRWLSGSTKRSFSGGASTGDVSATTLRATVSWTEGENEDGKVSTCIVTCNGVSRPCSNGGTIGFTGLNKNTTYTVSYVITDPEGNTIDGSYSLTTKQARFTSTNRSTKIIQFSSESVNSSEQMEQKIDSGDWYVTDENELNTHDYLTHNTAHTIYCRIAGCYAFDSSGNLTSYNDSVESQTIYTRQLSLVGSILEQHQHSLVTLWQAKVDGSNADRDSIDGTEFEFAYMDTIANKANPPYQASEVNPSDDTSITHGDYATDKKIYSDELKWYYCEYIVTASITDGYNIVAAAVTAHTIFPAAWIHSGGQWHRYMPHVFTNGKWVPAPIFVYRNNEYREPNGE